MNGFGALSPHTVDHPFYTLMTVTIIISGIFMSLSRVDVVFLFWSLFPVFFRIRTVACLFYSQSDFSGSAFLLVVLWVAVSVIPPFSNLFLLIFSCW